MTTHPHGTWSLDARRYERRASGLLLSLVAALALAGSACSRPEPQQPAASPEAAASPSPAPGQPATASPAEAPPAAADASPSAAPVSAPAALAPAAVEAPPPAPKPAPPRLRTARLAAGHPLTIRTTRLLSTKTMKTGDVFSAILEEPITVEGWVVAGAGARVDGRIAEADKGGRVKGKANLSIELTSLTTSEGEKVEIVTSPVSSEAAADRGKDAAKVGVGAGAGAAVGAIAGGGKGAAVGALIGGGAGAAMRGEAAEIPAETVLAFELRSPVTIREKR